MNFVIINQMYNPIVEAGRIAGKGEVALSAAAELSPFALGVRGIYYSKWEEVFGVNGTNLDFFDLNFPLVLNTAIDGGKKIHINIEVIRNSVSEILRGYGNVATSEYVTNWELYQIISSKKFFENTVFYLNGRALSSEELYNTHKIRSIIGNE